MPLQFINRKRLTQAFDQSNPPLSRPSDKSSRGRCRNHTNPHSFALFVIAKLLLQRPVVNAHKKGLFVRLMT